MCHCSKCGAELVEYARARDRYDPTTGKPIYKVWTRCPNTRLPEWLGRIMGYGLSDFGLDHAWRDDIDRREAEDAWDAEWAAAAERHGCPR